MKTRISVLLVCAMAVSLLSACSININGDKLNLGGDVSYAGDANSGDGNKLNLGGDISYVKGTNLIEEENLAQSSDGIKTFKIVNSAGNINITRSDSRDISVKITKKVKGTDEAAKKEVIGNIKIEMDKNADTLVLSAKSRDGSGSYIWDWVKGLYKSTNVTIDYDIKAPGGIEIYDIDNNAGNISIDSVSGEIAVRQDAGNLTMTGVSLEGGSSLAVTAGNIILDGAIDGADEVKVKSTAGNVNLKIPEASRFELEASLTAGNLSGSFLEGTRLFSGSFNRKFNGGGTRLQMTLTAGNAIIDGK